MIELKQIKESHKDLEFIFAFVERLTVKLIKVSVDYPNEDTVTFVDFQNNEQYHVLAEKVNRILDYCFHEYYFKIVLSGSDYYNKVKDLSLELDIEPFIFDLFFRCFFLAVKQRFFCETNHSKDYNINQVDIVMNKALSDTFLNIPQVDKAYFLKKSNLILKEMEKRKLINYNQNDLTRDSRFQCYFPVSCDTFKFYTFWKPKFETNFRVFEFLDLKVYLNNQNTDLLTKFDKAIQMIILICFKDVKFYNNSFSDNSYLKQLNLDRQRAKEKQRTFY